MILIDADADDDAAAGAADANADATVSYQVIFTISTANRIGPHTDFQPNPNPSHPTTYSSRTFLHLYMRDEKACKSCNTAMR